MGSESYTSEQLLLDAKAILEHAVENPHDLSPLPLLEAECAWLNTGLLHESYSGADQLEITRAIVSQALASMILDGYQITKVGET